MRRGELRAQAANATRQYPADRPLFGRGWQLPTAPRPQREWVNVHEMPAGVIRRNDSFGRMVPDSPPRFRVGTSKEVATQVTPERAEGPAYRNVEYVAILGSAERPIQIDDEGAPSPENPLAVTVNNALQEMEQPNEEGEARAEAGTDEAQPQVFTTYYVTSTTDILFRNGLPKTQLKWPIEIRLDKFIDAEYGSLLGQIQSKPIPPMTVFERREFDREVVKPWSERQRKARRAEVDRVSDNTRKIRKLTKKLTRTVAKRRLEQEISSESSSESASDDSGRKRPPRKARKRTARIKCRRDPESSPGPTCSRRNTNSPRSPTYSPLSMGSGGYVSSHSPSASRNPSRMGKISSPDYSGVVDPETHVISPDYRVRSADEGQKSQSSDSSQFSPLIYQILENESQISNSGETLSHTVRLPTNPESPASELSGAAKSSAGGN